MLRRGILLSLAALLTALTFSNVAEACHRGGYRCYSSCWTPCYPPPCDPCCIYTLVGKPAALGPFGAPNKVTVARPATGGVVVQFSVSQGIADIPEDPPIVSVQAGTMHYTGWNKQVSPIIGGPITYSIFLCPQSDGCKALVTLVYSNGKAGQVEFALVP